MTFCHPKLRLSDFNYAITLLLSVFIHMYFQAKRELQKTMKADITEANKKPKSGRKATQIPLLKLTDKDKQLKGPNAPKGRQLM